MAKSAALTSLRPKVPLRQSAMIGRIPFHYGWIVLFAGSVGMIMSAPGQTFGVSVFIEHFINDLELSRTTVSNLYAGGTIIGSLTLTSVGRLLDRYGPRTLVVAVAFLFGLACLYTSFLPNGGPMINMLMLGVSFTMLRMLGQGSLSLVSTNMINQWWVRRRGTILGISGIFTSLAAMGASPNVLRWLVESYSWRFTYVILAAVLILFMVPFGYLFYRDRPEEFGLLPDADKSESDSKSTSVRREVAEENWTLAEAMRTRVYWVFIAALASISMLGTGITFHQISIFEDAGHTAEIATLAFYPIAIVMAITNPIAGILVDGGSYRIPLRAWPIEIHLPQVRLRTMAAGSVFLLAFVLWMIPFLHFSGLILVFGIALGLTYGLMRTVSSVAWARYFGRLHLGAIGGRAGAILAASSALGPAFMGIARDLLGSYNLILAILAFFPFIMGFACFFVDRPERIDANESSLNS